MYIRALIGLLLLAALAGCGGAQRVPATAVPTPLPASALSAGAERSFAVADRRPLMLSPDGRSLAARTDNSSLCVFDAATLEQRSCSANSGIDPASLAWSPDGRQIAWTEDWARRLSESDIWVMDVATGASTNLTDDGLDGRLMGDQAKQAPVDMVPVWTADGSALLFARTDSKRADTVLYRIAATGGAPERVAPLASGVFALWYRPAVLPGGDLLYSVGLPDRDDPQNGIWRMKADGSEPRQLLAPHLDERGIPVVVGAGAGRALLLYPALLGNLVRNQSAYAILDLNSGAETPLKQPRPTESDPLGPFFAPTAATLSPDGSKVLYVYRSTADGRAVLAVSDAGAEEEHILKEFEDRGIIGDSPIGLGLNWASNNLIYGTGQPPGGLLIQLEAAAGK
jgi:dipeptidyl aminopeptidase/acylaminoacyl peptidase